MGSSETHEVIWPKFSDRVLVLALILAPVWYRVVAQNLVVGGVIALISVGVGVAVDEQWDRIDRRPSVPYGSLGAALSGMVAATVLGPAFGLLSFAILLAGAGVLRPSPIVPSGRVLIGAAYVGVAVVTVADSRLSLPAGALVLAVTVAWAVSLLKFVDTSALDARVDAVELRLGRLGEFIALQVSDMVRVLSEVWRHLRERSQETQKPVRVIALASVAVIGMAVALRDLRVVLYDDAAITFRFAERIAGGDGFTYNVGDRTNGASAPLYTLLLALARWGGADLETAAKALSVACYAGALTGVGWLAGRARGISAGAFAVGLLLLSTDFRIQMLSGMESGLTVMLGLGALLLWSYRHDLLAGGMLGLVVLNKLDGLALVVALCLAALVVDRKLPVRMLAVGGLTMMPWLGFSQGYFGSILPYSFSQKLGGTVGDSSRGHSPLWIVSIFARSRELGPAAFGVSGVIWSGWTCWNSKPTREVGAVFACGLWGLMHAAAYSILDLGDAYSWYTTVIYAALAVPAGFALRVFVQVVVSAVVQQRVIGRGVVGPAIVALFALVPWGLGHGLVLLDTLKDGHRIGEFEAFEATRRSAGQFLADTAADGEVVETCFGWPAYGALQSPIDEVCPLSTKLPVEEPTWIVITSWPGIDDVEVPVGFEVEAEYVSDVGAGGLSMVARRVSRG